MPSGHAFLDLISLLRGLIYIWSWKCWQMFTNIAFTPSTRTLTEMPITFCTLRSPLHLLYLFLFKNLKHYMFLSFSCILLLLLCAISSLVITRFVSVDEGVLQRKASKSHQLLRLIFPAPREIPFLSLEMPLRQVVY